MPESVRTKAFRVPYFVYHLCPEIFKTDGTRSYEYCTIFTEDDNDDYSVHYLKSIWNNEAESDEAFEIIEIPGDFYEKLGDFIGELKLEKYQNGRISPVSSEPEIYAYFTIETESGLQKNAYYEEDEAKELIEILIKTAEYLDKYF